MASKVIGSFVLCAAFSPHAEGQGYGKAMANFAHAGIPNTAFRIASRGHATVPVTQPMVVLSNLAKLEDDSREIKVAYQRLRAHVEKLPQAQLRSRAPVNDFKDGLSFGARLAASFFLVLSVGVAVGPRYVAQWKEDTGLGADSQTFVASAARSGDVRMDAFASLQVLAKEEKSLNVPAELGNMQAMRDLTIADCQSLNSLSAKLGSLNELQDLTITQCPLSSVPAGLGNLQALRHLTITACHNLGSLPAELGNLHALQSLTIDSCDKLSSLPAELGNLHALRRLTITNCCNLTSLPPQLGNLQSLKGITISNCHKLTSLPVERSASSRTAPPLPSSAAAAASPPLTSLADQSDPAVDVIRPPKKGITGDPSDPDMWEDCRSGEDCHAPWDVSQPPPLVPFRGLHSTEYRWLSRIQRLPGLLHFSMVVHYSLLPKVVTPMLALIVWLFSLPRGASLITFVCAADLVNTAIKWAVQRPRPRWYSPSHESGLEIKCGSIAWEVDLSFPSAHTQFFSGLGFCAAALYGWSITIPALFGMVIGLTRNYLSMHWPSDTAAGLLLGAALGTTWGLIDPWALLLSAGSPLLSLCVASTFTVSLLCLMVAVRQNVPPVTSQMRSYWYANALGALPEEAREAARANTSRQLKPRNLKPKIPMLVSVWATLAITGLYPYCLPAVSSHPAGSLVARLLQTLVGLCGLGGVMCLKDCVKDALVACGLASNLRARGALKGITYIAICAWTFLLSQLTFVQLGRLALRFL